MNEKLPFDEAYVEAMEEFIRGFFGAHPAAFRKAINNDVRHELMEKVQKFTKHPRWQASLT